MTGKMPDVLDEKRAIFKETARAAREIIATEVEATRKKTVRLKARRLAKEGREKKKR